MNIELSKEDSAGILKIMKQWQEVTSKQWQEVASAPITKGQKDYLQAMFEGLGFTEIQVNDDGTVNATFKGNPEALSRYDIALGKSKKVQKGCRYTGLRITGGGFEHAGASTIVQEYNHFEWFTEI